MSAVWINKFYPIFSIRKPYLPRIYMYSKCPKMKIPDWDIKRFKQYHHTENDKSSLIYCKASFQNLITMCQKQSLKSVTSWISLQCSNLHCCCHCKQFGTSSIHNYIEASPLQYVANRPCDPIKKQVQAHIPYHPWGLVENNYCSKSRRVQKEILPNS